MLMFWTYIHIHGLNIFSIIEKRHRCHFKISLKLNVVFKMLNAFYPYFIFRMDLYVTEYGTFIHLKCTQRSTTHFLKRIIIFSHIKTARDFLWIFNKVT